MNALVKFLAQYDIENIKAEEVSLEQAFIEFYEDDVDKAVS